MGRGSYIHTGGLVGRGSHIMGAWREKESHNGDLEGRGSHIMGA